MRMLEDAFVILHIKISHIKVSRFSVRTIFTAILGLLVSFGATQVYKSTQAEPPDVWGFIESVIYEVIILYCTLFWMIAWQKADRLLAKASDIGSEKKETKEGEKEKKVW